MKIGLIGAGRLGICLALLIEQAGHDVIVSDIREKYVEDLQKKRIDTNEPDVQWMLGTSKRLTATIRSSTPRCFPSSHTSVLYKSAMGAMSTPPSPYLV